MRIIFLGPPGSGKGTQAKRLSHLKGIPHLSTGDMFRAALQSGSSIGAEMKTFMDRGDLVPDGVVVRLIGERIQAKDCDSGFILDGFPRTIPQAEALSDLLKSLDQQLSRVVFFKIPDTHLVERLSQRSVCIQCGEMFHLVFRPPLKGEVCDHCGGALVHRADDQPDVVRNRLIVYHQQTEPLVAFYENRQQLSAVDASLSVEAVSVAVLDIVHQWSSAHIEKSF